MGSHRTARNASERSFRLRLEIATSLRRLVQALRSSAVRAHRATGLSGAQAFVLQHLAHAPALSLNELAARTLTHQSSVSVVVARLVERGLVRKVVSSSDRRRIELALTPRGAKLAARAPAPFQESLFEALETLPRPALEELATGLGALESQLGLDRAPAPLFLESAEAGR